VTPDARRIGPLTEELDRLDALLRAHDAELAASLNPPARDEDLKLLRDLMLPHELHPEVETLLRWHNGQGAARWWPLPESGPLLSATQIAEHHRFRTKTGEPFQWSSSWLPFAHEGWTTTVVECALPLAGTVIDASFPDPPSPKSFSLAHLIGRLSDLFEAGVAFTSLSAASPDDRQTIDQRRWKQTKETLQRAYPHFIQ
jgi:hypothetical protein